MLTTRAFDGRPCILKILKAPGCFLNSVKAFRWFLIKTVHVHYFVHRSTVLAETLSKFGVVSKVVVVPPSLFPWPSFFTASFFVAHPYYFGRTIPCLGRNSSSVPMVKHAGGMTADRACVVIAAAPNLKPLRD